MTINNTYKTELEGRIVNYYPDRGFGFARVFELTEGGVWNTVFVHISDVNNKEKLEYNDWVVFDAYKEKDGWKAVNVRVVE